MDAAALQQKIYSGYAKAAQRLGLSYDVYRPCEADHPLTHQVATVKVSFNARDLTYSKAQKPKQPYWYALLDGTLTQAGDYLIADKTFFIVEQALHLPILAVECNRTVKGYRLAQQRGVGKQPYSGRDERREETFLGNAAPWPASVLLGGRIDRGMDLPESAKQAGWTILLPTSAPVIIDHGHVLSDDLGRRYAVQAAELSSFGWRIQATQLHA